jgi:hypothetical protein
MNWYKRQIKISYRKIKFSPEQLKQIQQLAEEGMTFSKISKMFGISVVTLRNIVRENKWKVPTRLEKTRETNTKVFSPQQLEKIKELVESGVSFSKISKMFNTSIRMISNISNKNKWNVPSLSEKFKKMWEDQDLRDQQSERVKKRFEDPKEREQLSEKIKQVYIDNPELREQNAERMRELAIDPNMIKERSKIQRERFKDPKHKKHHSEKLKKRWEDQALREQASEAQKRRFEDIEERKMQSERQLKYWENIGGLKGLLLTYNNRQQAINRLNQFILILKNDPSQDSAKTYNTYNKYMDIINNHTYPDEVQQEASV